MKGHSRSIAKFVAISALCGWLGVSIWVYFSQTSLIFHPTRTLSSTPAKQSLSYDDVTIPTADGEELHAWFVPHARASATVLFFHGNAGNIADRPLTLARLHDMQLNVLMLEYRGYGLSSGEPSATGTLLDAKAAWRYLTEVRQIRPRNIVLYGRSLGGAVALGLAVVTKPRALIVESTFSSLADMAAGRYPLLPVRLLLRHDYASVESAKQLPCPILVAHSMEDEIVPFAHGRRLYDSAPQPKRFFRLVGSHNRSFVRSGDTYYAALNQFIDGTGIEPRIDASQDP